MKLKKIGFYAAGAAIAAVIGVGGWMLYKNHAASSQKVEFILQKAARSNLELTIAATGTVEPEELVNVGAQVGGMITELGTDANGNTINYGSEVKAGMILAKIDDALYQTEYQSAKAQLKQAEAQKKQAQTQKKQAEAQLKQAQAQKKNAEAGILQAKAKVSESEAGQKKMDVSLKKAEFGWERAKKLHRGDASTASEFEEAGATYFSAKLEKDAAEASVESAKANLVAAESAVQTADAQISSATAQISSAEAQISAADAQISAAQASLSRAERNLSYCVIKSPVDGVIIDRRVNVGQTVNSSMSAPSLFLIAKDLKKMQVWVSVNEADIKRIVPGQKAVFAVDAIPNEEFEGIVSKIRLNATLSQNVVTYVVEITTDNSDLKLLPYLTANVKFVLQERKDVLSVPNAAFRFVPEGVQAPAVQKGQRVLWVADGQKKAQPVVVRTGLNSGMNTEVVQVISGDLKDGSDVITGSRVISEKTADASAGQNPFMAKPPARGGKRR